MQSRGVVSKLVITGAMLFATSMAVAPAVGAQDAASTPGAMEMQGTHDHPAHIHSGTCDAIGDVVFPLENVASEGMMGTPMAGDDDSGMSEAEGTPMAGSDDEEMAGDDEDMTGDDSDMMGEVVAMSTTTVDASLDDILAAEHAINVHESAEAIDVYIACGEITGTADNGQLQIALEELNDSGYTGEAMLMDNGDGTTTVDVMLMHGDDSDDMEEMAEATPQS